MAKSSKFGTFGGVFVPSILTILGVIMYLRLPMIVGEAGLWATIGIIVVAHIISITTGLSVSSIATDRKVEAGGTYFMISRSLGLPIGGTLGLALFVGLSFSVSLYLIGFSESFLSYWGYSTDINNIRLTGSIILLAVTTLTFISTSLAIKTQYFIMAAIVLSLVSIFLGDHDFAPVAPAFSGSSTAVPLMVLFGIFFPAVTGFEAGVSMSGDLKDPKKSIPGGSIMAIAVGFVVYIGLAFYFAYSVDANMLSSDSQVLLKISWIPQLVIAGIWGATLSSALGSILGAPRILQATAIDKITPRIFGKGYGPTNEPRNALMLTFLIAEVGILIGELDVIARVVSIFFITTYGFLNISAAFERWTSSDFRPDFKISGWVSVLGALACIIVMIQLDFVALLGAIFILGLIYLYLKRKQLTLDSGDAWSGVWATLVKSGLTNLTKDKLHNRNWRPNIIMFSGNPATRTHLVEMGNAISGRLGLLSAFELQKSDDKILSRTKSHLEQTASAEGYFRYSVNCREVYEGMEHISRTYGFPGVEPNTILMGWSNQPSNRERFTQLIQSFSYQQFNTIFLNYNRERGYGEYKSVDIWWSGAGRNLTLAFNLIRLITNSPIWLRTKVRVLTISPDSSQSEDIYKRTAAILADYRIRAEVLVINNDDSEKSNSEIVKVESAEADLVIIGLPEKQLKEFDTHFEGINDVVQSIGSSLIISASTDFEELEAIVLKKVENSLDGQLAEQLQLEELKSFKYTEITDNLRRIDENGQKVLELFYQKAFQNVFSSHIEVIESLLDRSKKIDADLKDIKAIPELLKRKKAIDKLKSESLFRLKTIITDELRDKELVAHRDKFEETIIWYLDRLNADFRKYPKKLRVAFDEGDFKVGRQDSVGLKALKRWKKAKHFFVGKPITIDLPYREVARYYQLYSRLIFMQKLLDKFQLDQESFYKNLRKIGIAIISTLDGVEKKIWNEEDWSKTDNLSEKIDSLSLEKETLASKSINYLNRLNLEFRKNLDAMGREMEILQIGKRLASRSRPKNYYAKASKSMLEFSESFFLNTRTLLNMISLELAINNTRNRQSDLFEDLHMVIAQSVKVNYLKNLDQVIEMLSEGEKVSLEKVKFELDFDAELYEVHDRHLVKMVSLTEELPESVEIYSLRTDTRENPETISILVSRMVEYFMKSRYETPEEESFEQLIESLKRSVFTAQDAISLAQFNIENSKTSGEMSEKEINQLCQRKLEKEVQQVETYLTQFRELTGECLQNAFDPLSSVKIQESAEDFTSGLRSYQGQQMITGAEALISKVSAVTQGLITKLWYGRSETILVSKKLDKSNRILSVNSRLLDLKERLNPSTSTILNLPQYYISLFSGKSNIGKDFWIKRPQEEEAFRKAASRYKSGFGGGIMLLGERNSGKTAFGKHIMQSLFKGKNVYSIFPPISGTTSLKVFTDIFSKTLQKRAELRQMIGRLPAGSVIIINDLELFWERSENGLQVVRELEQLIDDYGQRVLFVVNMNPHAYRLINQQTRLADRFVEVINLRPFNAEELKDLILKRHKSSGLSFGYNEESGQLNDVQMASLFNAYFNYSNGNPGTALNGWITNMRTANRSFIKVEKPAYPSLEVLKQLDDEWTMLLIQFILHKRLNESKIISVTSWTPEKTKATLRAMSRAGVVVEKSTGNYHLDTFMQPFIVDALKDKEVLQ